MTMRENTRAVYYRRLFEIVKEGVEGKYIEFAKNEKWSYSDDIARYYEAKYGDYATTSSVAMSLRILESMNLVRHRKSQADHTQFGQ
jgi:hypothetical protein